MNFDTVTLDIFKFITSVGIVLLMVGVLPFTPAMVGGLILASMCELQMTWDR